MFLFCFQEINALKTKAGFPFLVNLKVRKKGERSSYSQNLHKNVTKQCESQPRYKVALVPHSQCSLRENPKFLQNSRSKNNTLRPAIDGHKHSNIKEFWIKLDFYVLRI